jgi:hypothetical protein
MNEIRWPGDDKRRKETGVDEKPGSLSEPRIKIKKREGVSMGRGLGLSAWAATIAMVGVLAYVERTFGDDTQDKAKPGVDAKTAFTRLKTLKGTWKSKINSEDQSPDHKEKAKHDGPEPPVVFSLTGAGSAVVETQFPGTGHEMVSVYHLDGNDLRMTHYCAMGNQPRVKLDRAHSTPDQLIFVFDGGTNLDPQKDHHIHGLTITFLPDGKVSSAWEGYADGKSAGTTTFLMSKEGSSAPPHASPTKAVADH